MSDAALIWNDFGADINIVNGDMMKDGGLASAVFISVFTDARSPSVTLLPLGENELKGWWGDLDQDITTGSLLWLVQREKALPEVAAQAREYIKDSLEWLVDDNIASIVAIDSQIIKPQSLQIIIKIHRGSSKEFAYLWEAVKEYESMAIQNTTILIQFIQ